MWDTLYPVLSGDCLTLGKVLGGQFKQNIYDFYQARMHVCSCLHGKSSHAMHRDKLFEECLGIGAKYWQELPIAPLEIFSRLLNFFLLFVFV